MADTSKLPTLEDFMEDSTGGLVNTSTQGQQKPDAAAAGTPPPGDDQAKAAAAKAAAEAEAKSKAEAEAKAKADAEAQAKAKAKAQAEEEEKKKKAASQQPQKTQAEIDALIKKAEEKPETLTADEKKYLLDNGIFEEEEAKKNFWEEVEAVHGIKVDVDYQGKDPESAEGAALRDQAIMNLAAQQQIAYLQETYPEAYQILEHVANGGKVQDLINADEPDFTKITLEKDDKEAQKELLLNYYLQKGFEEKDAKRYVEADEDSAEGLFAVATKALKQLASTQQEKQKQVFEQQKAAKAEADKRNAAFKQGIKALTDSGKLGEFSIANKKDREEFYQFAVNNIYSDGKNGYQVVLPVNDKTTVPVLQQLFFAFKGGKLDEFVKREAQTQNVVRLKRKVAQAAATASGQEGENKGVNQKTLPTFDAFTAE